MRGIIEVTKVVSEPFVEIAMRTPTEEKTVEVKWLIDLESKSKKLSVKYITPTEPNGTNDYLAYFKGSDLLLERTFHEKDGTWNVMRFHWRLINVNEIGSSVEFVGRNVGSEGCCVQPSGPPISKGKNKNGQQDELRLVAG